MIEVDAPPHGFDCRCADREFDAAMRCAARADWFEGDDPTRRPPPTPMNRFQHDADGMAQWARARRRSLFPWIRRRAHHAIQYAIFNREIDLGWRRPSMCEWTIR